MPAEKRASAFLEVPSACWEACWCYLKVPSTCWEACWCLLGSASILSAGKRAGACLEVPIYFLLGSVHISFGSVQVHSPCQIFRG